MERRPFLQLVLRAAVRDVAEAEIMECFSRALVVTGAGSSQQPTGVQLDFAGFVRALRLLCARGVLSMQ